MTNNQIFEWCDKNLSLGLALYDAEVFDSAGMYRSCEQWFGSQRHTYCDYFMFCNRDIERQMAITQGGELVAASHYRSGQGHSHYVFNKTIIHFENEAMLRQFQEQPEPEPFHPMRDMPFSNHGEFVEAVEACELWKIEMDDHFKSFEIKEGKECLKRLSAVLNAESNS